MLNIDDQLKFADDCPLNSFVYVTRKISETKATACWQWRRQRGRNPNDRESSSWIASDPFIIRVASEFHRRGSSVVFEVIAERRSEIQYIPARSNSFSWIWPIETFAPQLQPSFRPDEKELARTKLFLPLGCVANRIFSNETAWILVRQKGI